MITIDDVLVKEKKQKKKKKKKEKSEKRKTSSFQCHAF